MGPVELHEDDDGYLACPRRGDIDVQWCLGCPRKLKVSYKADRTVIECDPGSHPPHSRDAGPQRERAGQLQALLSNHMWVERVGPIVLPATHPSVGWNINGPALVRAPEWVEDPLGRYLLYFADHAGSYIRLAHAQKVMGPYSVREQGCLHLSESGFPHEAPDRIDATEWLAAETAAGRSGFDLVPHIASPDVVVDHERETIWMAFHGLLADGRQRTRVAESRDGVDFAVHEPLVTLPYLRILPEPLDGQWLAMAMPGVLYRSPDLRSWESGPTLFDADFRHCALLRRSRTLHVFWTRVGDAPEHILWSTIELDGEWTTWSASAPRSILSPEEPWEGAGLPVEPSARGPAAGPVCQLRDPAIFDDDGRTWLLYSIAGESGIAIAELHDL